MTTTVTVGDHSLELGSDELVELNDSSQLLDNEAALRDRLERDGYLFIRGFHDPELVREARSDVLEHMAEDGMLHPDRPVEEGVVHPDEESRLDTFDMTGESWTNYPSLERLVEGDRILSFFRRLLGEEPFALDRKLGRAKATGDFTGFHADNVFMSTGTDDRYTVWQAIGDCPVEMGPLVIAPASANHRRLRETYGRIDVGREPLEPHFSHDPHDVIDTIGGPLATANFEAGDALIINPFVLHGSLTNRTDRWRISVDTRYQSIWDPVDPRWVGSDTPGTFVRDFESQKSMTDLRLEWGLERPDSPTA